MLRWGILGTSFISETMAQAINDDPGSRIRSIAGRRPEAVEAFAQKFSVQAQTVNYPDLLNDPQVDIVYVGLPNHLHHQYIVDSLSAGKHVLSEKSQAIDMPKTRQIVAAVKASNLLCIEGLMYLHHPLMLKLAELLRDDVFGTVHTVSGQYCADIAQFVNPEGKGAIYNLGCYPISLLHLVLQACFGQDAFADVAIQGSGTRSKADGNIVEASLNLTLRNGVSARMHTAETYGMISDFVIVGEKGS